METRPSKISSSQDRREPSPAEARKRLILMSGAVAEFVEFGAIGECDSSLSARSLSARSLSLSSLGFALLNNNARSAK